MQTLGTQKGIAIVVGMLIIITSAYFLLRSSSSMPEEGQRTLDESTETATEQATEEPARGSFKDLLGKSGSQKCVVSQSSTMSKSSGTFYISNGKGRGDFESTVLSGPGAGTMTKSSMIMDGDIIYTWDESTKQGMKISAATLDGSSATPASGGATNANVSAQQFAQSYDYDCEDSRVDDSIFTPPAGIEFMDMNEMMKGLPNMGDLKMPTGGTSQGAGVSGSAPAGMDMSAMCSSCDQAGDGRDACRAALGCK